MKISNFNVLVKSLSAIGLTCVLTSCLGTVECGDKKAEAGYQDFIHMQLKQGIDDNIDTTLANIAINNIKVELLGAQTLNKDPNSSARECSADVTIILPAGLITQANDNYQKILEIQKILKEDMGFVGNPVESLIEDGASLSGDTLNFLDRKYILSTSDDGSTVRIKGNIDTTVLQEVINLYLYTDDINELANKARKMQENLNFLAQSSQSITEENGVAILDGAYPLAFNQLKFQGVEFGESYIDDSGYNVIIRLNYLNIFDAPQYFDLKYTFNENQALINVEYVKYSDIIKPGSLTWGWLVDKFISNS